MKYNAHKFVNSKKFTTKSYENFPRIFQIQTLMSVTM